MIVEIADPRVARLAGARRTSDWAGWFAWIADRSNGYGRPGYRWLGRYEINGNPFTVAHRIGLAAFMVWVSDTCDTLEQMRQHLDRFDCDVTRLGQLLRSVRESAA